VNDLTDQQLLRNYAERQSEADFAELARRHVDLVYSAALRMVCDSHLAQDVTQAVFLALAQNARQLTERPVLSGWLHRTAQNIASKSVRTEVRRRAREQEAAAMNELLAYESDAAWENIAPHLDTALGELSEPDRDALLLRYFERKSAREMAQTFGTSEEAAQKRVNRAVDRLRELFSKRNVTVGASGLAVLISTNSVQAAPIGLTAAISTAVSLAGTAVSTSTAAVATKTIVMTTLQKSLIATIVVAGLASPFVIHYRAQTQMSEEIGSLRQKLQRQVATSAELETDNTRLAKLVGQATNKSLSDEQFRELLRLRGEVGQLRNQKTELEKLRTENSQSRSIRDSSPALPREAAQEYYSKETWAFVGYTNPESAFQSLVWAMSKGDLKTMLASVSPEERVRMEKQFAGKSEEEIVATGATEMEKIKGFRILKNEPISEDEVILTIFGDGKDETTKIRVKRKGNEWKLAGRVKDR
jgi:RNA polymerase sigma factor (sigma-70 family)